MNTVEKIKSLCKSRKIPISRLEKECGFGNGYISQLRKGTVPSDRLLKIAAFLDIPVNDLLDDVYQNDPAILWIGEQEVSYGSDDMDILIDYARSMDEETLKRLLSYAEFLKKEGAE